jgi:hypothetical protein
MSNSFFTDDHGAEDLLSTWDEVRRIADRLEVKMHLATMDARDRWREVAPRLTALEHRMKDATQRASKAVVEGLGFLWDALRGIENEAPKDN